MDQINQGLVLLQKHMHERINLQHGFYIKVLNTNNRVQTQRKLKLSSKYNKILRATIKVGLASCPRCAANWPELHGEDGTHSTVQPGGSGCPIQDAQTSSKSAGTQPAQKGYNDNPEYTNTQQGLPDSGYP